MIDPLSQFDAPQDAYDASNASAVNIARQQGARKVALKAEVISAIMDNDKCREWLADILAMCNIFQTPFSGDPYETAFNSGKQFVGNLLLADIIADSPERYASMCREYKERNESESAALTKATMQEK